MRGQALCAMERYSRHLLFTYFFNFDTNVQKSATTSHKKRLIINISLNLHSWCLHAESNYELILTMDPLYHLTMEATC